MSRRTGTVYRVLEVLKTRGMTTGEIKAALGITKGQASSSVRHLLKAKPGIPKRAYISSYKYYDTLHGRRYPRAVYSLGDHPCVAPPKETREERRERKRIARYRAASVFDLGTPLIAREAARGQKRKAHANPAGQESSSSQVA